MAKRSIPSIPKSSMGTERRPFDEALKENIEILTGQRGGRIDELSASATLAEAVAKINEVIRRLQ